MNVAASSSATTETLSLHGRRVRNRVLDLSSTPTTDDDVPALHHMQCYGTLDLRSTDVTPKGLRQLKGLPITVLYVDFPENSATLDAVLDALEHAKLRLSHIFFGTIYFRGEALRAARSLRLHLR